jgi:hypothetical protein
VNSQVSPSLLQSKVTTCLNSEWDPTIWSRPDLKRVILALAVVLGLSSGQAQQDIDLTGYTLVFQDNFDTLPLADSDDKGAKTWFFWPPYGPAGAFSASHWVTSTMECQNGVLIDRAEWDPNRHDQFDNNWDPPTNLRIP